MFKHVIKRWFLKDQVFYFIFFMHAFKEFITMVYVKKKKFFKIKIKIDKIQFKIDYKIRRLKTLNYYQLQTDISKT